MIINEQKIHPLIKMVIKTQENRETEALRIDLNEVDTKKFRKIKESIGIQNKSDVIRYCLNFTFKNLKT